MTTELTAAPAAERLGAIVRLLRAEYPDATCALDHHNALQLLIATILSAQCTDERVNQVTPALFARARTPQAMAALPVDEVRALIRPCGLSPAKSAALVGLSAILCAEHGGVVPQDLAALERLPGVGHKTASVVMAQAFGVPSFPVDTHVKRLSQRLGLTTHDDPEKIERDLMAITLQDDWIDLSHLLIFHGRRICDARKPNCASCVIRPLCPSSRA